MTLQPIGRGSIAMLIEEGEIERTDVCGGLDIGKIKEIAEREFASNGILAQEIILKAFSGKASSLVFAYAKQADTPLIYSFTTSAAAAEASIELYNLSLQLSSVLELMNGRYYLMMRGSEEVLLKADWILREHGCREGFSVMLAKEIADKGKVIIKQEAVETLNKYW